MIYKINACQDWPSQYIKRGIPVNNINSRVDKSTGITLISLLEKPNIIFIQDLKKNVGPNKYKKTSKKMVAIGNISKKNEKNNISETKKIEPGKPKKISTFKSIHKKSLGHKKLTPLTSVIKRVLNLLAIASTSKNELVDIKAWLISIQKLANIKLDWPLTTQMVNQCISTTVE